MHMCFLYHSTHAQKCTIHVFRQAIVHNAYVEYQSLFILSLADWLSLISDIWIFHWVTLVLKCPLVEAILSVMLRKDEGLKDPPSAHQAPLSPCHLALHSLVNPLQYSQDILDLSTQQLTWIWFGKPRYCTCGALNVVSFYAPLLTYPSLSSVVVLT